MKFLRIERSLTSVENVVLTIVNRREGATLLNVDECHSIEVRVSDLGMELDIPPGAVLVDGDELRELENAAGEGVQEFDLPERDIALGTIQGL